MLETVLVLNANYEPINVCSMRRAMGLLLTDKAMLIHNGRGEIHTAARNYPRPSVIRLLNMVHRPRPHVKLTRRELFRRDNYTCQYCGKQMKNLTIDHIIPKHLGGKQVWTNVVAACPLCNHRKGGRTPKDANMTLLKQPQFPPRSAKYIFGHYLSEYDDWEQFLIGW